MRVTSFVAWEDSALAPFELGRRSSLGWIVTLCRSSCSQPMSQAARLRWPRSDLVETGLSFLRRRQIYTSTSHLLALT